ncbi:MAG: chromate transporter [Bacteroidales bacterium]|nr:chromate transporter [Bacteroidales bacterium]
MIFWKLFYTFLRIGIFNFGGGYAMIALIQNEVVTRNGWMTMQEFVDMVAVSQMTPGPIGINVATYAGYTAVLHAGYSVPMAVLGSFIASFSVILLPVVAMILVTRFLMKMQDKPAVQTMLKTLRITFVGLIAAAALLLLTPESFGSPSQDTLQFIISVVIFLTVFIAAFRYKVSPILLLMLSGVAGFIIYGLILPV